MFNNILTRTIFANFKRFSSKAAGIQICTSNMPAFRQYVTCTIKKGTGVFHH